VPCSHCAATATVEQPRRTAAAPVDGRSTSGPARRRTTCSIRPIASCSSSCGGCATSVVCATSPRCSWNEASSSPTQPFGSGRRASPRCWRHSYGPSGAGWRAPNGTRTRPISGSTGAGAPGIGRSTATATSRRATQRAARYGRGAALLRPGARQHRARPRAGHDGRARRLPARHPRDAGRRRQPPHQPLEEQSDRAGPSGREATVLPAAGVRALRRRRALLHRLRGTAPVLPCGGPIGPAGVARGPAARVPRALGDRYGRAGRRATAAHHTLRPLRSSHP